MSFSGWEALFVLGLEGVSYSMLPIISHIIPTATSREPKDGRALVAPLVISGLWTSV